MFQTFLAPFLGNLALNTLLTGKFDPMKSTINTATGQITGNLLNNIIPSNVLNSGGGVLDTVGGGGFAGMIPNTVDTVNLPLAMTSNDPLNTAQSLMPSYMDTSGKLLSQGIGTQTIPSIPTQAQIAPSSLYTSGVAPIETTGYAPEYMRTEQFVKDPTQVSTPLQTARTDIPQQQDFSQRPDFSVVTKSTPEEIASRTGGYEDKPLYQRAYDKVANYITENPVEAGMLGLMGGSAVYQGLNPRQQRVPLTQVTSSVKQATAPQFGSPLKIRRPGMRG